MEQHYLTNEQIAAFASSLVRAERSPATIEKIPPKRAGFLPVPGWAACYQGRCRSLERTSAKRGWLFPFHRQRIPGRHQ